MKKIVLSLLVPALCSAEPTSAPNSAPTTLPSTPTSCEGMLSLAGKDALLVLEAARCAEQANMLDLARSAYEQALSLAPSAEWAPSVRLRLSELAPKETNKPSQANDEGEEPVVPKERPLVARGPHQLLYGLSTMSAIFGLIFHAAANSRERVLELAGTGIDGQPPTPFDAGFQRIENEGERFALAAQLSFETAAALALGGFLLRPKPAKLSVRIRNLQMIEVKLAF